MSGWLVDRIGAKRVYLVCFTGFTAASMLCGLATSAPGLIGARILQGMAGGLLVPMAQMMIAREAGRHLARVMGIMVMPILFGPICGPALAGFILQHGSWRWIFFINLPVGLMATLLAVWILPDDEDRKNIRPFAWTAFDGLPHWAIGAALFLRGAGLGAITIPSIAAAYSAIPKEKIPAATTALNIVQRMGGPVATTVLAIFLHRWLVFFAAVPLATQVHARAQAFSAAFALLCAFHAAAVLAALRLPWKVAQGEDPQP